MPILQITRMTLTPSFAPLPRGRHVRVGRREVRGLLLADLGRALQVRLVRRHLVAPQRGNGRPSAQRGPQGFPVEALYAHKRNIVCKGIHRKSFEINELLVGWR